jgi:hypothetical protein
MCKVILDKLLSFDSADATDLNNRTNKLNLLHLHMKVVDAIRKGIVFTDRVFDFEDEVDIFGRSIGGSS